MVDGAPVTEPQLDGLTTWFPLPFRIGLIVTLAVLGWAVNLHILRKVDIDVPRLIRYPARSSQSQPLHHHSTYNFFGTLVVLLSVFLLAFWVVAHGDPGRVITYAWIPVGYLGALVLAFVVPLRMLGPSAGRSRFRSILRRVMVGGLAEQREIKFSDILIADVLTSYAKVLADVYVPFCMWLKSEMNMGGQPDRSCGGNALVPCITAIPSLIRMVQCLTEFWRVWSTRNQGDSDWGGQHLANALKYFSIFPVILFNTLQRNIANGSASSGYFMAWATFSFLNSVYSFYWDVAKDWDLTLFSLSSMRPVAGQAWGLRARRYFQPDGIYYAAIGADLLLRFTWSIKFSASLAKKSDLEPYIFGIELVEVFRRWMWIFFRVEAEWIRTSRAPIEARGILLDDYNYDEDDD